MAESAPLNPVFDDGTRTRRPATDGAAARCRFPGCERTLDHIRGKIGVRYCSVEHRKAARVLRIDERIRQD